MRIVYLYLLYLRHLISYYIEGKTGQLSDIVKLEEGFFHDLKGIYSKRLGLPINKFKAGDQNPAIAEDIKSGASEVVNRFFGARYELFNVLSPNLGLVREFRQLERLRVAIRKGNLDDVIGLLENIKKVSDSFYQTRVIGTRFELSELLANITKDLKTPCTVTIEISNSHHSLKLPYADYNTWKRIIHNIAINAIEASESKGKDGKIEINLTYPQSGHAKIEITDNGVGMDAETLSSFTKRGYTKGKISGQGLGVNEETVGFLNSNGRFVVESKPCQGTTITIEIDSTRIVGARARAYIISPELGRKLRVTAALLMMTIAVYFLLSIPFTVLRLSKQPEPPSIYSYELTSRSEKTKDFYYGIKAIDRSGKVLWERNLAPLYIERKTPFAKNAPIVEDINSDGRNEIIFSTSVERQVDSVNSGEVICMSSTGKQLWRHELGHALDKSVFGFEDGAEGPYTTKFIQIFPNPSDSGMIVMVGAKANYYPNQILLIDCHGKIIGEYWHAGDISSEGGPYDFDADGKSELLFYGVNNRLGWAPVLLLREIENFSGISSPFSKQANGNGNDDIYYLFGRIWPKDSIIGETGFGYNPSIPGHYAVILSADFDRYPLGENVVECIKFSVSDGRNIFIDKSFKIIRISYDEVVLAAWWRKQWDWAPKVKNWDSNDLNQLYGYRMYVGGEIKTNSILMNKEKYDYNNYWAPKLR